MSQIKDLKKEALAYHASFPKGKIEVMPTKPYATQHDLALAYSPGVAEPCLAIKEDNEAIYEYTGKGNLVGVISNGTAVLGLGNIGAAAGKPVMEGKSLLFKVFSGVDAFDIEVDTTDIDKFVETVRNIAPTFGGINIEDVKAPECFEIERRLIEALDIPVMHDDQHGTAVIASAALLNALEIAGKKIGDIRIVASGAGAAAIATLKLFIDLGANRENIILCDSQGVVRRDRVIISAEKNEFATSHDLHTLEEALDGADMFLGLSKGNILTEAMVQSMASHPIVFALANPDPEITYEKVFNARKDVLFATGRSDYPNQVNNALGFPYIFRGALDVAARKINTEIKLAAAYEIAALAKEPVPAEVQALYKNEKLTFGQFYLIPKPLDKRLLYRVSPAVAKAAMESGVARKQINDWEEYARSLDRRMIGNR